MRASRNCGSIAVPAIGCTSAGTARCWSFCSAAAPRGGSRTISGRVTPLARLQGAQAAGRTETEHAPDQKFSRDGAGAGAPRRQVPARTARRGNAGAARRQPGRGTRRAALVHQRHDRLRKTRARARQVAKEFDAHVRTVEAIPPPKICSASSPCFRRRPAFACKCAPSPTQPTKPGSCPTSPFPPANSPPCTRQRGGRVSMTAPWREPLSCGRLRPTVRPTGKSLAISGLTLSSPIRKNIFVPV